MTFLELKWLWILPLPFILMIGAFIIRRKKQSNWKAFVSAPKLVNRLVNKPSSFPWWLTVSLTVAGSVLLCMALATPTNGEQKINLPQKGRNIYLALDLSRSMLVEDVTPSRLTVAKTAAIDLIDSFSNEKIGLISFAGKAWLEAPLTNDHHALKEAVLQMNETSIPIGGSAPAPLLDLIDESQPDDELFEGLLIIISDGEFHETLKDREISNASENGLKIFTIGIGSTTGGYVPDKRNMDGLFRDRNGRPVLSKLNEEPLKQLANIGQGSYFTTNGYDFVPQLSQALDSIIAADNQDRTITTHLHLYQYFITTALLFLVLAMVTPALWNTLKTTIPLFLGALFLSPTVAEASVAETFKSGQERLLEKAYDEATKIFDQAIPKANGENKNKLTFSRGEAEYRNENYDAAAFSFSESLLTDDLALQQEAHYNLGNSLFKTGENKLKKLSAIEKKSEQIKLQQIVISEWVDALDHYRGALHLNQKHPTARANYDYVRSQLEILEEEVKQEMESQQNGEGEPQEKGEPDESSKGDGSEGENDTAEELKEKLKNGAGENNDNNSPEEPGNEDELPTPSDEGELENDLKPGESPQDYAERLLKENSDFESGNLRAGRTNRFRRPEKDW